MVTIFSPKMSFWPITINHIAIVITLLYELSTKRHLWGSKCKIDLMLCPVPHDQFLSQNITKGCISKNRQTSWKWSFHYQYKDPWVCFGVKTKRGTVCNAIRSKSKSIQGKGQLFLSFTEHSLTTCVLVTLALGDFCLSHWIHLQRAISSF